MTVEVVLTIGYLVGALVSMPIMGRWYLAQHHVAPLGEPYCHRERSLGGKDGKQLVIGNEQSRRHWCERDHLEGCWRDDLVPRERTIGTGFIIVFLSLLWGVLIWPKLALMLTPQTAPERERELAQLRKNYEEAMDTLEEKLK